MSKTTLDTATFKLILSNSNPPLAYVPVDVPITIRGTTQIVPVLVGWKNSAFKDQPKKRRVGYEVIFEDENVMANIMKGARFINLE